MKKSRVKQSRLLLVIIVVCAAFLAAFLGQILVNQLSTTPSFISTQPFVISNAGRESELLRSGAELISSSEASSFVALYALTASGLISAGDGVVLTNDGWVAAVKNDSDAPDFTHVRLSSGTLVEIEEVHEDPASPLYLVHIASQSLNPVTISRQEMQESFTRLLCADQRTMIKPCSYLSHQLIERPQYSSDSFARFAALSEGVTGDRVYTVSGELVGLVFTQEQGIAYAVESRLIRSTLDQVLRKGFIERPSLGLNYLDLSLTPVIDRPSSGAFASPALLAESAEPVLEAGSPAAASLRLQDIVVSVNGELVNHRTSLSDLILSHEAGESIELGLLRQGSPVTISVTLDLKSSAPAL